LIHRKLRPANTHAFLWEKLPYALHGNPANWMEEKHAHGAKLLNFWSGFAPNLRSGVIQDQFVLSPADTESCLA
jgi:hypothetical protein